ncbi:hypothetical protein Pmani_012476 [Petrolisthes manimaculis]|uniref:Uncharacterized protein n=1 Tax=Petrolisthes manimaculis TaxID=1843537 RepID=A0AAE1Q0N7_9EUCA|nr:hypothetical protein Pmani_012476 [Petrolisthes manimaculis]
MSLSACILALILLHSLGMISGEEHNIELDPGDSITIMSNSYNTSGKGNRRETWNFQVDACVEVVDVVCHQFELHSLHDALIFTPPPRNDSIGSKPIYSLSGTKNGVSFEWARSFMWVLNRGGGGGNEEKSVFTCDFVARIGTAVQCVLKVMEKKMREATSNALRSLKQDRLIVFDEST